jgi:putative ABC transport system permease protein
MSQRLVGRHAGRSALTVGVLFIAVASGIGTGNSVFSITSDIRAWYERTIAADFLLRTMMPDMTGQDAVNMPETLGDELAQIPGINLVDPVRFMRADARGHDAVLVSRNFSLYERLPLAVAESDAARVLERVKAGEVVVGSVLAERAEIKPGDELEVTLGSRSRKFRVAALASEYTFGGSVVYLDRHTALDSFKLEGVDSFLIRTAQSGSPEVAESLRNIATRDGLLLQSFGEVSNIIDAMVSGVVGGLWILLALGLLVGALGVVNTLTMNVLEQTRELGMLRAVGMQRVQIIRIVLGEAGFIGALGVVLGGVAGIVLAWTINLCLGSLFGHHIDFALRASFVLTLLVAAMAVVMTASLVPALRAARLNPIVAMRDE